MDEVASIEKRYGKGVLLAGSRHEQHNAMQKTRTQDGGSQASERLEMGTDQMTRDERLVTQQFIERSYYDPHP